MFARLRQTTWTPPSWNEQADIAPTPQLSILGALLRALAPLESRMTDLLIIANGLLLPDAAQPARPADLLIEAGCIREIGTPGQFAALADARVIDASDRLVIPGLVNGHTHAHGALGRGAVADVALEGFLAASPAINGARGLDDLALSATLTAVELLKNGCTAMFDVSGEFPHPTLAGLHAVASAYARTGIRAVVAPMMADRTLYQAYPTLLAAMPEALQAEATQPSATPAQVHLDAVRQAARDWPFDPDQVRLGLAPTIPLHCSDDFLRACAALSEEFCLPMQTHLAESRAQAHFGEQRYGRSLVAHLARLGLLSPRFSVAHAIWVSDADIAVLAQAGVTAIHNPLSNLRLGSGIAPVRRMIERGLRVGLGTDGANTADTQNLFEAARLAAGLSRVVDADDARWVTPAEALRMATEHSAAALGWAGRIGRITPGAAADLVLLDLAQPVYVPLRDALRQLVLGENAAGVDRVLVAGRVVVERGRVTTVDEPALRRQAAAAAERLDARNADGRHLAEALRPWVSAFCCGIGRERAPAASTAITLRPATLGDAGLVADIIARSRASAYRGMLPDGYLDEQVKAEGLAEWPAKLRALGEGAGHALIAMRHGAPIGFICMMAPDADHSVLIDNLHTLPDQKGSGAGTAMLAAADHWARPRLAKRMHLFVIEANTAAIGFYESRGWQLAGRQDDRMGGADIVTLRYDLALG